MRFLRVLQYVWVFPTTAIGLVFAPLALISGGGVQVHTGVLEVYGGLVALVLRFGTFVPGGASAMALGHVVLAMDRKTLDWSRKHERVHVRQAERWGPFFIPAYILASAWVLLCGGEGYLDNPFEREAYERA